MSDHRLVDLTDTHVTFLWKTTPMAASRVFDLFCIESSPEPSSGCGIAWLLQRTGVGPQFVVATRFGLRRVKTFEDLMAPLHAVGTPTDFPLADWPGVTVSMIA